MASTMASAGRPPSTKLNQGFSKATVYESICRLYNWLEKNAYSGYDTFDGLSSPILRPLTFRNKFLRTVLQQGVRRFPLNLRPIVGIKKSRSTKGMGFLARGFIRLHQATGATVWRDRTEHALEWLKENRAPGFHGSCWANHFDYQSRSSYVPKGLPSVVWTSLIGQAFLDAYEQFQRADCLEIAVSCCEHILHDLGKFSDGQGVCIGYFPTQMLRVHNANTLAAGLLARTYRHTGADSYLDLARKSIRYTAQYQRPDFSWYYGEAKNLHWVDNFHTAYVLDSFKHYCGGTGDDSFAVNMMNGYQHWKNTFFLSDGTPRYYNNKTSPIDIQCSSQAIDTLVFYRDRDPDSLLLASRVAMWTIKHMQDPSGYFYYRRYSPWIVNKTPTLHWGQATMLCALAGLYQAL